MQGGARLLYEIVVSSMFNGIGKLGFEEQWRFCCYLTIHSLSVSYSQNQHAVDPGDRTLRRKRDCNAASLGFPTILRRLSAVYDEECYRKPST